MSIKATPVIDYAVLKNELLTDKSGLGYSGLIAIGDDTSIANRLNSTTSGLSGLVTQLVFRNDIGVSEIAQNIASGDYQVLQQIQLQKLQLMFAGTTILDATAGAQYRFNFNSIFSGMPNTQANLANLAERVGSRAEVLFGDGIFVSATDVAIALK